MEEVMEKGGGDENSLRSLSWRREKRSKNPKKNIIILIV